MRTYENRTFEVTEEVSVVRCDYCHKEEFPGQSVRWIFVTNPAQEDKLMRRGWDFCSFYCAWSFLGNKHRQATNVST